MFKTMLVWFGIFCAVLSSVSAADKISEHGIESRRWRIAKYRGDGSQNSDEQGLIPADKTANITFAKGHIRGSAGCGALVGTYSLSGDRLIIQADFILAGACTREGSVQNQLILTALKGDLRMEEKDDHILLRDTSGKARLLLAPYSLPAHLVAPQQTAQWLAENRDSAQNPGKGEQTAQACDIWFRQLWV